MNVEHSGGWEKDGETYRLGNGGPVLTINVDMGAGSLQLKRNNKTADGETVRSLT